MKGLDSLSPARLAALGGAGSLLVMLAILRVAITPPTHHRPEALFWIMVVGGYAVMLLCETGFRRGIDTGRWPEAQLQALRRVLSHGIGMAAAIAIMVVILLLTAFRRAPVGSLFPMGLLAYLYLPRLTAKLRVEQNNPPRTDWSNAVPLRSDHWGERASPQNPPSLGHSPQV